MEHFSTFNLFSFVLLDSQAVGFMDVFLSFLGCRYEVCLFLKLCSFQVNVWHKYKPKRFELNTETHVIDVRTQKFW